MRSNKELDQKEIRKRRGSHEPSSQTQTKAQEPKTPRSVCCLSPLLSFSHFIFFPLRLAQHQMPPLFSTQSSHISLSLKRMCVAHDLHQPHLIPFLLLPHHSTTQTKKKEQSSRAPLSSSTIITHPLVFSKRHNRSHDIPLSPQSLHHYSPSSMGNFQVFEGAKVGIHRGLKTEVDEQRAEGTVPKSTEQRNQGVATKISSRFQVFFLVLDQDLAFISLRLRDSDVQIRLIFFELIFLNSRFMYRI